MRNKFLLAAAFALTPLSAFAHVTLVDAGAAPGAHFVARFRVGHGCNGSPTTGLSIAIPAGISDAQPLPVPGWTPQKNFIAGRLGAVAWAGGSLANDTQGEFAVAMTLPGKPGPLVFAATQTCANIVENWSEVPAPGQKSAHPAPVLYVGQQPPKPDGMAPGMVMPPGSHM